VIHAHADDVLPYTVNGVPFRAMAQTAGFVGYQGAHTFDVERYYERGDAHDLLIKNTRLGAAFAAFFSWAGHRAELPEQTVVLMRRHGFTTWGRSLKEAVYRAVYATKNAKLQTTATLLRGAFDADPKNAKPGWSDGVAKGPIHAFESLTEEQAQDTEVANSRAVERPWGLWVQEVRCQALYTSSVYTG
jgi:ribulose-5-phosphate 4-epimerase/fuculose-1-phosphate aldolase